MKRDSAALQLSRSDAPSRRAYEQDDEFQGPWPLVLPRYASRDEANEPDVDEPGTDATPTEAFDGWGAAMAPQEAEEIVDESLEWMPGPPPSPWTASEPEPEERPWITDSTVRSTPAEPTPPPVLPGTTAGPRRPVVVAAQPPLPQPVLAAPPGVAPPQSQRPRRLALVTIPPEPPVQGPLPPPSPADETLHPVTPLPATPLSPVHAPSAPSSPVLPPAAAFVPQAPAVTPVSAPVAAPPSAAPSPVATPPRVAPEPEAQPTPRSLTPDDLSQRFRTLADQPRHRVRRWFNRLLPSRMPQDREALLKTLRTALPDALTIAVVSPKGSSGKTPIARGVGAALGAARGGGVVVVDMNEPHGTLGQRSVLTSDNHVGMLMEHAADLSGNTSRTVDLERYMHRQPDSFEWILTSHPDPRHAMSLEEYRELHVILRRFNSVLLLDTGPSELTDAWTAATRAADLLVVPIKWRADHVEPVARMLSGMLSRGERVGTRTVIVASGRPGEVDRRVRAEALQYFDGLPIFEVPNDPALDDPIIKWAQMAPRTQIAFEAIGARLIDLAVARMLGGVQRPWS